MTMRSNVKQLARVSTLVAGLAVGGTQTGEAKETDRQTPSAAAEHRRELNQIPESFRSKAKSICVTRIQEIQQRKKSIQEKSSKVKQLKMKRMELLETLNGKDYSSGNEVPDWTERYINNMSMMTGIIATNALEKKRNEDPERFMDGAPIVIRITIGKGINLINPIHIDQKNGIESAEICVAIQDRNETYSVFFKAVQEFLSPKQWEVFEPRITELQAVHNNTCNEELKLYTLIQELELLQQKSNFPALDTLPEHSGAPGHKRDAQ